MSKQVFGPGKNPPWARTNTNQQQPQQSIANISTASILNNMQQTNMMQYQPPQPLFTQNLGIQQMQNQQLGIQQMQQISQGQIFPQMTAVAYPNPRTINNQSFQNAPVAPNNSPAPTTKQRVFTGTVTKIHNDFGFVDDDVFFLTHTCVNGTNPSLGDRVLVEASFNSNMPFKWNATRIQVLPLNNNANNRRENASTHKGYIQPVNKYNAVPPPESSQNDSFSNSRSSSRNISKNSAPRRSDKDRKEKEDRHRDSEAEEADRRKRRDERDRVGRDKNREEKDKHSPSRRRSRSPKSRRRARLVSRYMVQIPKIALNLHEADVIELTRRYSNLYIPSDFFKTHMMWVEAFPPDVPFTLSKPCSFHVMHKEVESIGPKTNDIQDPPDADYLFSAKVMLLSMPAMEEIYRKCCSLAEDENAEDTFVHPTRLINFLVGLRGKNETMAIGGPWSPSLDGLNPERNPSVLIKTAIRTCRNLTGIDLSNCTQWYRFVELYYRRSVSTHKGRQVSARVETVVIFLPDVWSCVPTRLEWDNLTDGYRQLLHSKDDSYGKSNETDKGVAELLDASTKEAAAADAESFKSSNMITDDSCLISGDQKPEPTHFSELDPKTMKVTDLRLELEARSINSKGLKSQLIARLVKALKAEADKVDREDEEEEAQKALGDEEKKAKLEEKYIENKSDVEDGMKDETCDRRKKYDDIKSVDKERMAIEKQYILPDSPHIIVHPSKVAKSGKFDCISMSLSLLLDYRPEDTKEHSFEVSLFAELFNEMLMRDFGFNIYRALYAQPEKLKEETKKDKPITESSSRKSTDDSSKRSSSLPDNDKKDSEKTDSKKYDCKTDDKRSDERKTDRFDSKDDRDDDDDDDDDDCRASRSKNSKRCKMFTKDPNLLLSFVYFDQTHCGYIFEKDVEELLYMLGLDLSRAQVRKIVNKVVSRNSLHYRKLTDQPKEDFNIDAKLDVPSEKADIKYIASGNKRFLPIFCNDEQQPTKRIKIEPDEDSKLEDGLIMYKGGLLDIEKLMSQMSRSEKNRIDTEQLLVEMKQKNSDLLSENVKTHSTIKELNKKLSDYRSKLSTSEREVKEGKIKAEAYGFFVKTIQSAINTTVEKINRSDERLAKYDDKNAKTKIEDKNISHVHKVETCVKADNEESREILQQPQAMHDNTVQIETMNKNTDKTNSVCENEIADTVASIKQEVGINEDDQMAEVDVIKSEYA